MSETEDTERRNYIKGQKSLNRKCHCGRMRVNHTRPEAIQCDKTRNTGNKMSQMTPQQIEDMRAQKI